MKTAPERGEHVSGLLSAAIRERDEARAALLDAHRGIAWLLSMAGGTARIPPTVLMERFDGAELVTFDDATTGEKVLSLRRPGTIDLGDRPEVGTPRD